MKSLKESKIKIRRREDLSKHTTFRIGGKACFWFEPIDIKQLRYVLEFTRKKRLPLFVIAQGSNILVDGKKLNAVVIKLSKFNFIEIDENQDMITAGAGVKIAELLKKAQEHSLSGLEFLFGIPGSLGGALVTNAGVSSPKRTWIDSSVVDICVMDRSGRIRLLDASCAGFGYRKSNLGKYIILFATLKLKRSKKKAINKNITVYKKIRKHNTPGYPNAGCIFRNPSHNLSAAKLIDQCGLKNESVNGAFVWHRHANFIINKNNASFNDVIRLIHKIKETVKERFNVDLVPEIKIWKT